ncbi:MAG TPA: hypothetical protein VKE51_14950 [Vicinamibacterales bacterium]|nr:hypothetical protein [Vicinamibacterales bacterium]
MSGHPLELLREVRLVVVVVVQVCLQQVERYACRPFAMEALEPEDLRENLRRQANMPLKHAVEIAPRIAGVARQFAD